jgi:hypothetical protein
MFSIGLTLQFIGIILQISGMFIIFTSNLGFWRKARRECGGVKRYSIYVSGAVLAESCEDLKRYSDKEVNEMLKKLPLSEWIYKNWKTSFIGSILTLIGVIITITGISLTLIGL